MKSASNRIYVDSTQTKALKQSISTKYIQQIAPHQLMIQALLLQNKQIYQLQQKYKTLLQQTKNSKSSEKYTQQQKNYLEQRQNLKIYQRKLFIQQGLKANSMQYHEQFIKKKNMRQDQLSLKKDLLKELKQHKMNVFFSLKEGIIEELAEFVKEKEKQENKLCKQESSVMEQTNKKLDQGGNKRNIELFQELNLWKKRYETQIVNSKSRIMQD